MQGGMKQLNTVDSPNDGHIVPRNVYRKQINMLRKIMHQVGFIYKINGTKWHQANGHIIP